ncbi:MAG: hypothetical protein IJB57_04250 [Clostridia bacterium]|nr:hypothetical protein [Clostridia bacterium]
MKKFLALLLTAFMLIALVACTGGKAPAEDPDTPDKPAETAGDGLNTALFTLEFDKDVWTLDEESASDDEEYCSANLQILDPDDPEYYLINVDISANITDPYDFREDIVYYGFDQYEYAENNSYELVNVGGVDCLKYEGESWGETTVKYLGRAESAGATVEVAVSAEDVSDSRIATLLEGLKFTLADTGNEDGPWEWEGEPFSAEDASVAAGSFTVETKWLPINEYISTFETFEHDVAAVGNTVYILTEGTLKQYAYDGSALNYEKDIELEEDGYDVILKTDDGSVWLTGGMNDLICIKDGAVAETYADLDTVAVSPDGTWGVSYFTSNECKMITFNGGTASATDITFAELDMVSYVKVDNDAFYVCGNAADESGHKVFIYNKDGVLQKTLCDGEGEGLGSITYFAKTGNGYIGFDGNMRTVLLWDADGAFIAELEDSDLFGTSYPWFCGSDMLSDGSIITVMTEDRADESATELVAFIVKGF